MDHKKIYEPLDMPRRVILGPGPSSANPRVLRAMSLPIVGYLDPAFFDLLEKVSDMLNDIFLTKQMSFAVAGSGSAGMEAGLVSLAEPGDKVIICSYGYFCERQIIMAERLGLNVIPLRTEWGKSFDPQVLLDTLKSHTDTKLVLGIHAETSTGTINPIKEMAKISHDFGSSISVLSQKGVKIHKINLPVKNITNCTFGGKNNNDLFISTARKSLKKNELLKYKLSGSLFKVKTNIKGIYSKRFKYSQ